MSAYLDCGSYRLALHAHNPLLMGIINITPDSFFDGGQYFSVAQACQHAEAMIDAGVDILDIGGESTRPGSQPVSLAEELDRVIPVIEALRHHGLPLSVDTSQPQVMRAALAAGAHMINDIRGFRRDGALAVIQNSNCAAVIMHCQGRPSTMQQAPQYDNVCETVREFLQERVACFMAAGIARSRIMVDPGCGFGKTPAHNIALIKNLPALQKALDLPILLGVSRKSFLGEITGQPVEKRLAASIAAALVAARHGVNVLRVHDVQATKDALEVWQALKTEANYG